MENASKAILIAGAILITLIVSTIIIIFFNKGAITAEYIGNNIKESDVQNHNAQFNIYEGTGRTKGDIARLVAAVNSNNSKIRDNNFRVTLNGAGIGADPTGYLFTGDNVNATGNSVQYGVSVTYNQNGIISAITVN